MANDTNFVVVIGNLTKEAELKYTKSGTAVCEFSIATNRRIKSGDEWKDSVSYINLALFGKQAESVHRFLTKGTKVAVSGEIYQSKWEQDGKTRYDLKIDVKNLQLLGGKPPQSSSEDVSYNDDIPF